MMEEKEEAEENEEEKEEEKEKKKKRRKEEGGGGEPLQGLKDSEDHTLAALAEVAWHDPVSLPSPKDLGHGANPSTTPEVQVLCCGSSSCVKPVLIVGNKKIIEELN
ncbi:hypothetical protein TREES_T100007084 [Tupaia chinensis]|uniref:Uncharacterized protein n=1 Tax=Tupaia chinensis TaxID=246437 RepID=L9LAI6_TUPCH|nr:hypothetical protein TREES_T100007084 [Tupaia chinensis]